MKIQNAGPSGLQFKLCTAFRKLAQPNNPVTFAVLIAAVALLPSAARPHKYLTRIYAYFVRLGVTVRDTSGQLVPNLSHKDFAIYENDVEQQVDSFKYEEGDGCSVGLVVDATDSAHIPRLGATKTAGEVIRQLRETDEVFVMQVGTEPRLLHPFTSEKSIIENLPVRQNPSANADLVDTIAQAAEYARTQGKYGRKTVIVFTDRGNRISVKGEQKPDEWFEQWHKLSGVMVYLVADTLRGADKEPLIRFAANLRGNPIFTDSLSRQSESITQIIKEMHAPYWLTYSPGNERFDGTFRKVRVEVRTRDRRPLSANVRGGYWAPKMKTE